MFELEVFLSHSTDAASSWWPLAAITSSVKESDDILYKDCDKLIVIAFYIRSQINGNWSYFSVDFKGCVILCK
jgi:hypothetical protein